MECCMMSRSRARALAEALRKKHRRRRKAIDVESVRMYCITNAERHKSAAAGVVRS